jgi:hypothetical protein
LIIKQIAFKIELPVDNMCVYPIAFLS